MALGSCPTQLEGKVVTRRAINVSQLPFWYGVAQKLQRVENIFQFCTDATIDFLRFSCFYEEVFVLHLRCYLNPLRPIAVSVVIVDSSTVP
jgi:hypothetical protein